MKQTVFFRILIFEIAIFISTLIFTSNTLYTTFNKKEILNTMISVISIIVAIIVTYLFSKLFSDKSIKIERKKEIDQLSKKITYLRRLAFHITSLHEFWKYKNHSIKSTIDHKYKILTYEEYRGYDVVGHRKLTSEELEQINKDIYGTDGQAYLALKGLIDGDSSYVSFTEFNPQNYSLDDIERYKEYSGSFWYFLDRSDREVYDFNRSNKYWLNFIDELYFKIMGKQIDTKDYRGNIKDLFSYFDSEILEKHYYLNKLNSDEFPPVFKNSFLNMLIFLTLLISSVVLYVVDGQQKFNYISTLLLLSLFIANTIDLIIISYYSIKNELYINDVFEI